MGLEFHSELENGAGHTSGFSGVPGEGPFNK